ncbi:hypothetical protein QF038_001334 [Pseudarthrobacter sp. W1I19]|uniref:LysM peptidoglycan-binding domain-containing protein n=1 Tax=Pseudarthrobacter sp. W1I19 TaxID=3042288 RepID=UPI002781E4A2|nr:LysM domain-containing protein [Pseudarthrobacter sp. W1I19]MDQ0922826.1 hypothetical protein [Pseudarthrobacter sp. W1I19]
MPKQAESSTWTDALCAAAILLLGGLLCLVGAGLLEQWQHSSAHRQELQAEDLLGATAAAAGAILVGWWFLSLLLAGATIVFDRMGKMRAAAFTRRLSPAFMQRLVLAALSVQLVAGPAANAAATIPGPEWAPTQEHVSSAPAGPGNVTNPSSFTGIGTDGPMELDPLEEPVTDKAFPPSDFEPGWQPAAPVVGPGLLAAPAVRNSSDAGTEAVTVLAGDTLWDITAFAMGPEATDVEIAMAWPRWYEANRSVIGLNPDVLLPGQILQPPTAA